jgi:KipI family sensor histidine kinase inhibitor
MLPLSYTYVADQALLVSFGDEISDDLTRVIGLADRAICDAAIVGGCEITPALVNLLIIFDPLITDHARVEAAVAKLFPLPPSSFEEQKNHVINVCYEAPFCPDLDAVAAQSGISTEAVMAAHLSGSYRVGMYGFAPGYAYLAGVPEAIQVPRKATPVRDVPAGSVMIAGPQCLCTTLKMPTGWSIIGRTDAQIMRDDPKRPFLFDVGDTVSFQRVNAAELGAVADG